VSPTQPSRLVTLGDLLLDVVITPDRPIERGTDVPGSVTFRRGGSASNTAAAFAALGGAAALITSLGDDAWAGSLLSSLRADGVMVHAVRHAGPSGRLAALIDDRGERSFVTERGAADALEPADLRAGWLRGADALHVPAYSLFTEPLGAAALEAASRARQSGTLVSTDLSSAGPLLAYGVRRSRARLAELAPDILFANRAEAAALLRETGRRAWARLLGQAALVIVKDGVWGCRVLWMEGDLTRQVDVAATRVGRKVDTTGAGDAFAAGFLLSLLGSGGRSAMDRDRALRRAAMAGHRAAGEALRRGRPVLELR
jgi:sugar/nucleoside kinase (ribokinase family)